MSFNSTMKRLREHDERRAARGLETDAERRARWKAGLPAYPDVVRAVEGGPYHDHEPSSGYGEKVSMHEYRYHCKTCGKDYVVDSSG